MDEIIGGPLTRERVKDLINGCVRSKRQLNMGRDGLTHNMLDNIHAHWKRRRVCKIKCEGVCTVDMNNVCQQLEDKTGGKIIYRKSGVVYLFRGRNYNYRTRPRFALMLWKPVTPVYPRLIHRAPEGLTLEEAAEMCKKWRKLIPICKLAKNGAYPNPVREVGEAFEECELVRINCQEINGSDYRKIGAKLKELVPCVLFSFEDEHILMWRGRDWKSSFTRPVSDCEETKGPDATSATSIAPLREDQKVEMVSVKDVSSAPSMITTPVGCEEEVTDSFTKQRDEPAVVGTSSTTIQMSDRSPISDGAGSSVINEYQTISNAFGTEAALINMSYANEMPVVTPLESAMLESAAIREKLQNVVEGSHDLSEPAKSSVPCTDGVPKLLKQAVGSGSAVLIDASLDADSVYKKAVAFAESAPSGPIFRHRSGRC